MSNMQLLAQDLTFEQFISRLHAQEVRYCCNVLRIHYVKLQPVNTTPTSVNSVATPDRTRLPHTAS